MNPWTGPLTAVKPSFKQLNDVSMLYVLFILCGDSHSMIYLLSKTIF